MYNYTDKSNWLFLLEKTRMLSRITIQQKPFLRLNTSAKFEFPTSVLSELKSLYNSGEERGGLVLFEAFDENGIKKFVAKRVIVISNITKKQEKIYEC